MVQKLWNMGTNTLLLTGDNQSTARYFAQQAGMRR